MGKPLTKTNLSQRGFPKKQSLGQDLWASWIKYPKGSLSFFGDVIPVSRTEEMRVRQWRRKSQYECMLLRLPPWTQAAWFCLDFQKSIQNASQNYVVEGWKAGAFMNQLWFLIVEGTLRMLTPRDVDFLTLNKPMCMNKVSSQGYH